MNSSVALEPTIRCVLHASSVHVHMQILTTCASVSNSIRVMPSHTGTFGCSAGCGRKSHMFGKTESLVCFDAKKYLLAADGLGLLGLFCFVLTSSWQDRFDLLTSSWKDKLDLLMCSWQGIILNFLLAQGLPP